MKNNNYFTKENYLLLFSSTILKQYAVLSRPVLGKSEAENHLLSVLWGWKKQGKEVSIPKIK